MNSKKSRRRKAIKIRAKINDIIMRKITEKVNGNRSWFFKSIRKMNKSLVIVMGGKRENKSNIRCKRKIKTCMLEL